MNKSLSLIALFILFNLTLFAQDVTSPRIVHTKEKSAIHVPAQEIEAGLKTIYSNLGASRTSFMPMNTHGQFGVRTPREAMAQSSSRECPLLRKRTPLFRRFGWPCN